MTRFGFTNLDLTSNPSKTASNPSDLNPNSEAVGVADEGYGERVEGVIVEEKVTVLETCSLGSMVLLAFPDVDSWQRLLSHEVLSTWFGRLEAEAVVSKQSQEVSVASPREESSVRQVGATSPRWHANQLWGIDNTGRDCVGSLIVAGVNERVVCDRGGVRSEGDVKCDNLGVRSWVGLDTVHRLVAGLDRDSSVSQVQGSSYVRAVESGSGAEKDGTTFLESVIVGCARAVVVPVIGVA
ncbi:hypothetical protein V6N12_046383 [Hibiscus sabdariffa]|uniref:Uncharacterized protein n=1 Tax=Hibiscus sabdariffa TaxID=183260 RepID=A0ABR2DIH2_9ROSI